MTNKKVSHGSNRSKQGGSLKSIGRPLVRKVRGVDHGRVHQGCLIGEGLLRIQSDPERKVVDVMTRPARPERQREDATNKRRNQSGQSSHYKGRPCPYYLRSRLRANDGIPEEQRNIEIDVIPHSKIRRRSLSMEALDGDPVHRI
ncbi:hypothetical protein TNCV_2102631 [Trichonephila clavipes]|nr:hypothetical protein TNCV_2102631 [Trichonephila clavipes]